MRSLMFSPIVSPVRVNLRRLAAKRSPSSAGMKPRPRLVVRGQHHAGPDHLREKLHLPDRLRPQRDPHKDRRNRQA